MTTSRLKIYNDALLICGERALSSLTENREPRHLLDHVYDNAGFDYCLMQGQWKFAIRGARLDYSPSVTPSWGYSRAFEKPSDWLLLAGISGDEFFNSPLTQFEDERGYLYSDLDELYVRFVSNGATYGGDLSLWPPAFADYVSAHFAAKIILKITSDERKRNAVLALERQALKIAKNNDAIGGPTRFMPEGSWSRSRRKNSGGDRGNRGRLIG